MSAHTVKSKKTLAFAPGKLGIEFGECANSHVEAGVWLGRNGWALKAGKGEDAVGECVEGCHRMYMVQWLSYFACFGGGKWLLGRNRDCCGCGCDAWNVECMLLNMVYSLCRVVCFVVVHWLAAPVVDNGAVKLGCKVHAIDPLSKAKDKLAPGMILVAVNGNDVQQTSFVRILDLLALTKTQTRTLQFTTAVAGATPTPAQKKEKSTSAVAVVDALSSNASTDGSFLLHKLDDVASVVSHTAENPLVEAYSAKKETRSASATTPRSRALAPSNQNQQQQQQQQQLSLHLHGSCTTPRKRSRPETHGAVDKENATAAGAKTEPRRPTKPIIRDREQHETAVSSDMSFGPAGTAVCPSCSSYCKHVEYLASEVESLRAALRNMSAKHAAMKQEIVHKRGYIKTVENKLAASQQQLEQTRSQLEVVSAEKERALVQQQAAHGAAVQELQQAIDELTRQNEEQQQKLQDLAEARNRNEEVEQLREELLQTQQKLKLRSGQCLLKEGQKQKAGMNFEAQLLEMQAMLEALRESEQAMKHKLRQKDGRLMLMQAQLSRLRQSAESAVEPAEPAPAETPTVVAAPEQKEEQQLAAPQLPLVVAAPGSEKTDDPDDDDDSLMEEDTDAGPAVQADEQPTHVDDKQPCLQEIVPDVQKLDAETQAQLSFREETAALQLDIVERLQNEKDGLHALIQSMKADKDVRERIVETMRQELQSIIGSHLEMKAELAESKETIRKLNDENVKLQARLAVLEVENKLWHEMPSSPPNRAKRLSPIASPARNSDGRRSPSPFPLREVTRTSSTAAEEEDSVVLGEVNEQSPCDNSNHASESVVSAPGCDDPTPVRVSSCTLRVDPMSQSTQSLLRMVASQSPVANDSPSTPKSLPLSGAHISHLTPFAGVETPAELHSRVSAASNTARSSNNTSYCCDNVSAVGATNASMVTVPLSSPSKRSPLAEPSPSSSHRSIQPVRTPPRSRSRDDDDQDAVDLPAPSPSKTDNSSVHSFSRFLEWTYDSEMMADATLLDSSISLMAPEHSPVSVVSHISPTSFNTAPQTPVSVGHNASLDVSQCEGVFPSPHNMIASRKYLSSQMLYQILKSTPMRAQTIQDPMHAAPVLLRERALLTQQSPTTQRVVGC